MVRPVWKYLLKPIIIVVALLCSLRPGAQWMAAKCFQLPLVPALWFAVPMVVCNCPQVGVELAVAMLTGVGRMKHFCALETWMRISLWNSML